MILDFLRILLGRWLVRILFFLAIGSALSKYIPSLILPSWVPYAVFDLALVVGAWDVFKKKQEEVERLRASDNSRSDLVIYPQEGSRYYVRADHAGSGRILGTCIHFSLIIANKGKGISIINRYELEIDEMGKINTEIRPRPAAQIQGLKTLWALGQRPWLMDGSLIKVEGGKATHQGFLPFEVPGSPPDGIGAIHCKLTVYDDSGTKASCNVEVAAA